MLLHQYFCKGAVVAVAISLVACSQELSRTQAGKKIEESLGAKAVVMPLNVSSIGMTAKYESAIYPILVKKGWLEKKSDGISGVFRFEATEEGKRHLTPDYSGIADLSFIADEEDTELGFVGVPVASPEIVEVSGLKQGPDGKVIAEFSYAWELNDVGKEVQEANPISISESATAVRESTAVFEKYDDGWRLTDLNL